MSTVKLTRGRTTTLTVQELISKWASLTDAEDLVSSMVQHQRELKQFLTRCEIGEQFFPSLVRCLNVASETRDKPEEFEGVLKTLCESPFLTHHVTIYTTSVHDRIGWKDCQEVIKDVSCILAIILNYLPQFSFKVMVSASQLILVVRKLDTLPDRDRLLSSLETILNEAKTRQGSGEKLGHRYNSLLQYKNTDTPPDDFLDISVVPKSCELLDTKTPFLREAVVKGPYVNEEQYLDIHFRLMKLDFTIPLKNGLKEYRSKKDTKGFRCSDIRLYHGVCIVQTSFKHGYNHLVEFDITRCQRVDWESTDRLMNGSLVCLSKDGFKTMIVATVARRDVEGLKVGRVELNVKDGLGLLLQCTVRDVFIMAESATFYDPYFHVLEGLKTMKGKFPFQDVLILCKPELKPPAYILNSLKYSSAVKVPHYDLSCLMKVKQETLVPVLTTVKWPEASAMCLNDSQRDAAILALTKEVCVIQGPPGTGKTYVGLKVVETLLKNKHDSIKGKNSTHGPILIVCYTNHALDQFLEGIAKFCPTDIVRIGGGCKTESLQKFNLNNLKRTYHVFVSRDKSHIEKEIHRLHCNLSTLRTGIQSADVLRRFIDERHYESLTKKPSELSSWLNAPKGNPHDELPKQIKQVLKKLTLLWKYSSSKGIKLGTDMSILDRCAIYFNKVKKVREEIKTEMHFARRDRQGWVEREMKQLLTQSYSDILTDDIFDRFLGHIFTSKIRQIFSQDKPDGKNIVEFWLLGQNRQLKGQLQDIEVLSRHLKKVTDMGHGYVNQTEGDICFEPMVFTDSESEELLDLIRQVDKLKLDELEDSLSKYGSRTNSKDDWQNVNYMSKYSFSKVLRILASAQPMTDKEERNVEDIWKLNIKQRYSLYMLWLRRCEDQLKDQLKEALEELKSEQRLEKEEEDEQTAALLKRRQIIGMTTTGAAKYKSLLEKVSCSVVVVEEAAEVLESHVITALNENCQHLILIGDHQQLRPKPATYELERNFGLDVSLFERLIKNNIPHVTLKIQHRMRPEVSQIIKLIYPGLEDHPSVCEFEHIRGVSKDVFFINHSHQETRSSDNFSKSNLHEAEFAVALCRYLFKQDYEPSQITILATYKGQVSLIKKTLGDLRDVVRVSAVDDFQGEENEIIILSFVRSNEENIAGFVKIDNRVCVALSRAKKGFFVLGNFDFLVSKSKLWKNIIEMAKKNDMIGQGLPVCCFTHPESVKYLSTAEEFKSRPKGGCGSQCLFLLKCGHRCQQKCHGNDVLHENYVCEQACLKSCKDGHQCSYLCNEVCCCQTLVSKTLSECGHQIQVLCHVSSKSAICPEKCSKLLSCGHLCQGMCKDCVHGGAHEECTENVQYTFQPCGHEGLVPCCKSKTQVLCEAMCTKKLKCGHLQQIPCHQSPEEDKCSEKCPTTLTCGHPCAGQCGECSESKQHEDCRVNVDFTYQPCGHSGQEPCCLTKEEARCPKECSVKLPCGHPCSGKCSECLVNNKHKDCLVEVDYTHQTCGNVSKVPCYKSSTHIHCTGPCTSTLKCGHPCSGKCSECLDTNKHQNCLVEVDYTQPSCGHVSKVLCYKTSTHIVCTEPCTSTLKCGHKCKGTCSGCLQGLVHQVCNEYCHLPLPCGHPCQGYCSTPCLTCELPCPFKCRHKSCTTKDVKKTCGEPCTPCRKKCMQKCAHLLNLKYCSENWDDEPCSQLCTKKLKSYNPGRYGQEGNICVHPCRGICGEMCVCPQCEKINCISNEITINTSELNGPILKLPLCRHIFSVEELDLYVMGHDQSESGYINCPLCDKPILNCLRYDAINQERFHLREKKKEELIQRNNITSEMEDKLERSRNVLIVLEDYKHFELDTDDSSAKFSNQAEFLSESTKQKFIYAVAKLNVDLKDGQQSDLINILNKTTRFSQQTEMEMNQEITRRLSLNALNFIEKHLSEPVLQNSIPKMNEIKDELKKAPTKLEVLDRSHEIISQLYEAEKKSEKQQSPDLNSFHDTHTKIVEVLKSGTDKTLVEVLYPDTTPTNKLSKSVPPVPVRRKDLTRDSEEVKKKTQPETPIQHRKQSTSLTRENLIRKHATDTVKHESEGGAKGPMRSLSIERSRRFLNQKINDGVDKDETNSSPVIQMSIPRIKSAGDTRDSIRVQTKGKTLQLGFKFRSPLRNGTQRRSNQAPADKGSETRPFNDPRRSPPVPSLEHKEKEVPVFGTEDWPALG